LLWLPFQRGDRVDGEILRSVAYSTALLRIFRQRDTALGARVVPSKRRAIQSRTFLSTAGSLSVDTGRVWLLAQRNASTTR
jgi:hypothetical protein